MRSRSSPDDLLDRDGGVVVARAHRHGAEELERGLMCPAWKVSVHSRGIGGEEVGIRVRQRHHRRAPPSLDAGDRSTVASPKSNWAWPGGWLSGTKTSFCRARPGPPRHVTWEEHPV